MNKFFALLTLGLFINTFLVAQNADLEIERPAPYLKLIDSDHANDNMNASGIIGAYGNNGDGSLAPGRLWYLGSSSMSSFDAIFGNQTPLGKLLFATNGAARMAIDASGNMGIGTTDPLTRLSVTPNSLGPKLTLYDFGSTVNHGGFGYSSFQMNYHVLPNDNHVFYAGGKNGDGTELMRIAGGNGNVGIGTASPSARLHVVGTVLGTSNTTGGTGVRGESKIAGSSENIGVIGEGSGSTNTNAGGFFEASGAGPTNYGVFARASGATSNFAGAFDGNVSITGSLAKGSGSFKIDHPLDPENKYLYHSFVESPDMMNVYNGNITTDASGLAEVELPNYFMTLNQDFRYQLTVIGTFAQAIISQEVANNRFVIKTDEPSVKVSWQVTGIRKDPYAIKNRIQEEVDKAPNERGLYLHPEAYGQPASMGISAKMMKAVKLERADKKAEDIN